MSDRPQHPMRLDWILPRDWTPPPDAEPWESRDGDAVLGGVRLKDGTVVIMHERSRGIFGAKITDAWIDDLQAHPDDDPEPDSPDADE